MLQLDESALKARNTLFIMFLALSILDVALILLTQDKWAIGRILFTIGVMYFVMQGHKWAKWLLMAICSLLFVTLIALVLALSSKLSIVVIVGSLSMAILSAAIVAYMTRSESLNRYFSSKRKVVSAD